MKTPRILLVKFELVTVLWTVTDPSMPSAGPAQCWTTCYTYVMSFTKLYETSHVKLLLLVDNRHSLGKVKRECRMDSALCVIYRYYSIVLY